MQIQRKKHTRQIMKNLGNILRIWEIYYEFGQYLL